MAENQVTNLHGNSSRAQTEEDDDLVILPHVDNSELIAQFKLSLVGRIFNTERSVEALIAILPRPNIWDVEGRVRGLDLGNQRFQFDFESERDLVKVLNKRPCHFNKWAFSLERWIPHVGDTFPNTMTFWVSFIGIPTHFWMDPVFESLGGRLGTVGPIDAKAAKVQVEINMDRPLKFALRAQVPSGEIVPVKVVYSNLHRYCRHCRYVSHEIDSCPQLSEAERKEKSSRIEEDKDISLSNRFEDPKNGVNSKRSLPQSSKDRQGGEDTHRDTRDSVWKRIDSRYDPRVASRPSSRYDHRVEHMPSDRDRAPAQKESYNKRRYAESFVSSKQREASRRDREKGRSNDAPPIRKETRDPSKETARSPVGVAVVPQRSVSNLSAVAAKQDTVSPQHVRERPFRLNLQQRASSDLKLKGKISEINDASDEGSSARKSLNFKTSSDSPSITLPTALFQAPLLKDNPKTWYEMTLEDEETMADEAGTSHDPPLFLNDLENAGLPLTERILEEEDWLDDGNDFGDADGNDFGEEDAALMDVDDLLGEELQSVEKIQPTTDAPGMDLSDTVAVLKTSGESGSGKPATSTTDTRLRTPRKAIASPSNRSLASSGKSKKASRSPALGVSLRQRHLSAGFGSPKPIVAGHGLSVSTSEILGPVSPLGKKINRGAASIKTNNSKVASGKPPKAP
ncbi:hypothetical protein Rs2_40150 [Raphanus sativus]|nr:hypothetical protein Rs2_40150 [Raphanus sativus]